MGVSDLHLYLANPLPNIRTQNLPQLTQMPSASLTLRICSDLNQLLKSRSLFQPTPGTEDGPRENSGGRSGSGGGTSGPSGGMAPSNTPSSDKKALNKQHKWNISGIYRDMYYGGKGGGQNHPGYIEDLSSQ